MILAAGLGMIGVDESKRSVETCLDVFEERLKIAVLSRAFGGPGIPHRRGDPVHRDLEVESYRRSVSTGGEGRGVDGKVALVTGAAQGFGRGIAEGLFAEGANVVIADVNEAAGAELAAGLNARPGRNGAVFVRADVTDPGIARAPRRRGGRRVRGRRPPRVERGRAAGRAASRR